MVEHIPISIGEPSSQPASSLGPASGDRQSMRHHWADSVADSSPQDDVASTSRAGDSAGKPERASDFRRILDGKMQQADPESARTDGVDQTPQTEKPDKEGKGATAVEAAMATLETGQTPASELAGKLASKTARPTAAIHRAPGRSGAGSKPQEAGETAKAFVPLLKTAKSDGSGLGEAAKTVAPIALSAKDQATKSGHSVGEDTEIGPRGSVAEARSAKPATPETSRTERPGEAKTTITEPAASQTRRQAAHASVAAADRASAAADGRISGSKAGTGPVRLAPVQTDPQAGRERLAKATSNTQAHKAEPGPPDLRHGADNVRRTSRPGTHTLDKAKDSKESTLPKVKIGLETQDAAHTQPRDGSPDTAAQAASATVEAAARAATHRAVGENSTAPGPASAAGDAARSMTGPRPHEQITQQLMDTPPAPGRQIQITLNPPELGRVQIRFTETDGQVHGHLQVENAQTRQQIERHVPEILAALQNQGLQVRRIDVTPEQPHMQHQPQTQRDTADQTLSQFHDAHSDAERSAHHGHDARHSAQPSSAWVEPAADAGVGVQQYAEDRVNLYI